MENNNNKEFKLETEGNLAESEFIDITTESLACEEGNQSMQSEFDYYQSEFANDVQMQSSNKSSGTSNNSKITTAVAAVAGIAVIAMTVISGSASFSKFDVYGTSVDFALETSIEYQLEETQVLDYDNFDTNLRMITFSSDTENSDMIILSTGNENLISEMEVISADGESGELEVYFEGRIEGLYEGTEYTTQVIGEDENGNVKVYIEKKFTTTGAQTFFEEISWECKCTVDGNFYFTMKYLDENGYYDNFQYKMIYQPTGETLFYGEITDPTQTQSVYVAYAPGMDYILEISFDSSAPIDVDAGETSKMYQINVKI